MDLNKMITEAIEISNKMDEVVEGFVLMAKTAETLEKMADSENAMDQIFEGALLLASLELVATKVDGLLAELMALEDEEIMALTADAVKEATAGKEQYVLIAGLLVGGIA